MSLLANKRALITGMISERSIAYGIARCFHREGAELAFTYQSEKLRDRTIDLAAEFGSKLVFPCDVSFDDQIDNLYVELQKHWDGFDILVHSIAYAPADQLSGDYLSVLNREGFRIAHDVSSYSFSALAKGAALLMEGRDGSMLTLSYMGSEKAFVNYNVMGVAKASLEANVRYMAASLGPKGIRVNAVSAGPIRTLAASGVKDFRKMQTFNESVSPLRKSITIDDVGNTASFLCSNYAAGITGEIVHVDAGFHIVGICGAE